MTTPVAQNTYVAASGTTSTAPFITVIMNRAPTGNDMHYLVGQRWVNTAGNNDEWFLLGFVSSAGVVQANWILLSAAATAITQINGDTGSITTTDGIVTIYANNTAQNCGSTVSFTNSGSTSTLNVTSSGFHTIIGNTAGNGSMAGSNSTALGYGALNAAGIVSTAVSVGSLSLHALTSGGNNTAVSKSAGQSLVSGQNNLLLGASSGTALDSSESANVYLNNAGVTAESHTLRIGSGTGTTVASQQLGAAYISGIYGITTTSGTTATVLVSDGDQLGTVSSSIRYKENVKDIGEDSSFLHQLRPVQFNYKAHKDKCVEYGLIAEEVLEVAPHLVNLDKEGKADSVKYHVFVGLLLNEIQSLKKELADLKSKIQ